MVEDLHDIAFADRAGLEILHAVFAREVNSLDAGDRIDDLRTLLGALQNVNLIADEDLDRRLAGTLTLTDPLLDAFEGRPLADIKQINNGGRAVDVFVHILVVTLLAGHVEVDNLVLVGVVDVESCLSRYKFILTYLDVELAGLLVFDDASERLRNSIEEGTLADARVTNQRNLEPEVVVIVF